MRIGSRILARLWPVALVLFTNFSLADWKNHRGDPSLQGISSDQLGDELILEWTFAAGKFLKSSPVVSAGKIFLGGPTGIFHALDFKTGKEIWKAEAGIGVDAPALIFRENVLIGSKDGWLICLDASTGEKKWTYETMGEIVGAPNNGFLSESNRSVILVGSYDNFVHCVDARTGKLLWKFETLNYINGTPAIWNNEEVVFGGCDAQLYIISLSQGKLIRQVDLGAPIASSVGVKDTHGYVGDMDKTVHAIDLDKGQIGWSYEPRNFPYFSSPALTDNLVIIGGRDKGLHAIDRETGKQIWRYAARGRIDGSPVVVGNKVIVGSMDGKLYQIDLRTGKVITQYEIGASISSTCAVSNGWIFVGCEDGSLYAFSTGNPK
jgi:outer membrane protein assembly factor BamB